MAATAAVATTTSKGGDDRSTVRYGVAVPTRARGTRDEILDAAQRIMAHKGYAAVGISEVLADVGVPKGSFYHWFASKDAFGVALIDHYFTDYLARIDQIVSMPTTASERLQQYWQEFHDMQSFDHCQGKCLVVKLGAEVSDLSEPMRLALIEGTDAVVSRIEQMILDGLSDGSVSVDGEPREVAHGLYDGWVGASILAKIHRSPEPLTRAMNMTRRQLHFDLAA